MEELNYAIVLDVMRPIFGTSVTASDVERLTSEEGEKAFVRLCATLVAAAAGTALGDFTVPNWSERITVSDKGVDGEYLAPPNTLEVGGPVGPGRNVYQVKWRRIGTRPARPVIRELRASVNRGLKDLLSKDGRLPDRYVLLINLDLSRSDRASLSQALRKDCPEFETRPLIIWGAAEIAALLNTHPHVRHAFFSEGVFCTLEIALEELRRRYEAVGWAEFVGYEESVQAIQAFAAQASGKLLLVSGSPYSGKSRTILEALEPHGGRVVWTSEPSRVTEDHFRAIDVPSNEAILVIDDCQADSLEVFQRWALSRAHLKTILISRRTVAVPDIPTIRLDGLPLESVEALLGKSAAQVPYWVKDWIRQIAGNLPGLILYALAAQRNLPDRPVLASERQRPRQVIGALLRQSLLRDLPEAQLEALAVLAILPQVGVEGEVADELATIVAGLKRDHLEVIQSLPSLIERHVLVRRGRFVEVVPELLASDLATETFKSSPELVTTLWLRFDPPAQDRLLRRLLDLSEDPAIGGLLDEALSGKGWFRTLDDLRIQSWRFHTLAEARPKAALAALQRLLGDLDVTTLRDSVSGDLRREIVWSLEAMALRADTFSGAAELLLRLAEAENETFGNNAAGVFLELFHWRHPYMSAPQTERVDFLLRAAHDLSPARRILVARAAGQALKGQAVFSTHRRDSISPPEEPARLGTWGDVWQFHEQILDLLIEVAKDQNQEVRTTASYEILDSIREMLHLSVLQDGIHPLASKCFETLREFAGRDLDLNQRSKLRSALNLIEKTLRRKEDDVAQSGREHRGVIAAREYLRQIWDLLEDRSFKGRVQRWVGPRALGDNQADLDAASRGERETSTQRIIDLVKEAIADATVLTPELLDWLMSDEAKHAACFFIALGENDVKGGWQSPIIERLGTTNGPFAFGWYVKGVAIRNRAKAEEVLDRLALDDPAHVRGILSATFFLPATDGSVRRLLFLVERGLASSVNVTAGIRYGGWVKPLTQDVFTLLVNGLDDGTVEATAGLVELLGSWLYFSKEMTEELQEKAWLLLERSAQSEERQFADSWDMVASWLVEREPERFFDWLERIVDSPNGLESAKVFRAFEEHADVWRKLLSSRRERTLLCLLNADARRDDSPFWVSRCLEHLVDSDSDAEILIRFATGRGRKEPSRWWLFSMPTGMGSGKWQRG